MSGILDYSRWDRLAADLSDSDEEQGQPQVTSLHEGGSVTIGPDGPSIASNKSAISADGKPVASSSSKGLKGKPIDASEEEDDRRNGGITKEGYLWKQDEREVVIKVPVEQGFKARDLKMKLAVDGDMKRVLTLSDQSSGADFFTGTLRFPVAENNDEDEDPFDWEIKKGSYNADKEDGVLTEPQRYIHITMVKKSPIPNAVHWWSHVFEGDKEIDVTAIADRRVASGRPASSSSSSSSSGSTSGPSFSENWEEAHRLFRAKRASSAPTEKITIDGV